MEEAAEDEDVEILHVGKEGALVGAEEAVRFYLDNRSRAPCMCS